jgi:deoxyribodipyrimidine photo-lyase
LKAKELEVPLIAVFIVSPEDYRAHLTSAVRVDFELRTLGFLRGELGERDIPLVVESVEKRGDVGAVLLGLCREWGAKHLFCNLEYEVDELRRETRIVRKGVEEGVAVEVLHDDVVVPPGECKSGAGKQYSVYSPWYRNWVKYLHDHPHLLKDSPPPEPNPPIARTTFASLFHTPIPSAPPNKSLTEEERERYAHLWPAGEHAAHQRLSLFLSEKIQSYKSTRNFPAQNSTSLLSVHFSTGTLAARTAIRSARDYNTSNSLDKGNEGITTWISELAWRDFYKHVLCHWPYVCMSKPFKYEYSDIEWEYNEEQFEAWKEGRTGFPIVDAAMRQMRYMGWMHNRCRMIVGCFLAKDLLLDWRMGERYFMECLIDGDFGSNNGGWGFCASTGVDPQPYFRIFNPLLQSEKFDEGGEFIRKWVPELRDVEGKAVHDPYGRKAGGIAERNGYPRPIVDHRLARERALERYKGGLGRSTANVGGGVHN